MRVRIPFLFLGVTLSVLACLPKPDQDFDDFGKRANALPTTTVDASFEAEAPPTEAVNGVYYLECLSELAFGQPNDVLSFFAETKFVPEPGGGGKLSMTIQTLKLGDDKNPPATISKGGVVGNTIEFPAPAQPNVAAADGRYSAALGTVTIPGAANPITGRDIIIEQAVFSGFFGKEKFCAQLSGNVTQPIQKPLTPANNICQFYVIKDGDPRPAYKTEDFQTGSCPY